jgi:oxygen-dependent protoporphyrinogen oxidase
VASVVVVGGGLAGLACAFRLTRAGHEVEVLERQAEAGGSSRADARGRFVLDAGSVFDLDRSPTLRALARALGISDRLRPLARASCAVLRDFELHPVDPRRPLALAASPLLSLPARARLARLGLELARRWPHLDPRRPEALLALDRADAAAELRRAVGAEALEYLLAPLLAASCPGGLAATSWAGALLALRAALALRRPGSLSHGDGTLTRALAERVNLRPGCQVLSVETESGGARVSYRSRGGSSRVLADAAVVALPARAAAALCPKLTPAERGFLEQARSARAIEVLLLLDSPPATLRHHRVLFPRPEGVELAALALDHDRPGVAPPGAGLLRARLGPQESERLWGAPDEALRDHVQEQLGRTPLGRLRAREFAVRRDAQRPLCEPGALARLARFQARLDRSPRLAFATDPLPGPDLEATLASGARAATEVARGL